MDNTQAEAVLLALGPQLEWMPPSTQLKKDGMVAVAKALAGGYLVRVWKRFFVFRIYTAEYLHHPTSPIIYCPQCFKHSDAAKAACERHHATGKWE